MHKELGGPRGFCTKPGTVSHTGATAHPARPRQARGPAATACSPGLRLLRATCSALCRDPLPCSHPRPWQTPSAQAPVGSGASASSALRSGSRLLLIVLKCFAAGKPQAAPQRDINKGNNSAIRRPHVTLPSGTWQSARQPSRLKLPTLVRCLFPLGRGNVPQPGARAGAGRRALWDGHRNNGRQGKGDVDEHLLRALPPPPLLDKGPGDGTSRSGCTAKGEQPDLRSSPGPARWPGPRTALISSLSALCAEWRPAVPGVRGQAQPPVPAAGSQARSPQLPLPGLFRTVAGGVPPAELHPRHRSCAQEALLPSPTQRALAT